MASNDEKDNVDNGAGKEKDNRPEEIAATAAIPALSEQQLKQLYIQAMDDYATSLKLEKPFHKDIKDYFSSIQKEFKDHYAKHGSPPPLDEFQKELESLLNDQHITVASKFSTHVRDSLGNPDTNEAAIQRKLDANIRSYAAQRAHMYSHSITDTTRDNFSNVIREAHVSAAEMDIDDTNENIAKLASDHLGQIFDGRSVNIATTETGVAVENGKILEYETLSAMDAVFNGRNINDMKSGKMWISVLDSHTREDHVEADSQVVAMDEPFQVGEDQMLFPKDDSLGAGPDQICNCRCCSEFIIG
jgi:hypothetical protein